MKMTMTLEPKRSIQWQMARQIGVEGAVFHFLSSYKKDSSFLTYKNLKFLQEELAKEDLDFSISEGDPLPLTKTKLGLAGRDKEIAIYCDFIRILGDLGIPTVCYNFMAGLNWARTETSKKIRGGALSSGFRYEDMEQTEIDTQGVRLTTTLVWNNLYYFLDKVLPVAEQAGVNLSLHPDDPPIENFYNLKRIISSPDAYRRIFRDFPSDRNTMTFCQSNIKLMDIDIYDLAEEFGKQRKISFVHFRDIEGDKYNFHETFHDDGPTDMNKMMKIYQKFSNNAFIRPDHVPTLVGEDNTNYGYNMLGRLYAIGYMKGLMDNT